MRPYWLRLTETGASIWLHPRHALALEVERLMATGRTTAWAATLDPAEHGVLDSGVPTDLDRRPDVLVVGGGVLGLATAVA